MKVYVLLCFDDTEEGWEQGLMGVFYKIETAVEMIYKDFEIGARGMKLYFHSEYNIYQTTIDDDFENSKLVKSFVRRKGTLRKKE